MKAIDKLREYLPCEEAVIWLGNKSLQEAWETCDRGDWMLWAYKKLYPDNLKEIALAKGYIANTVRHLMKDARSINAVDASIDFGNGLIDISYLESAYAAAYAAADAAYSAANATAYSAAYTAANADAANTAYSAANTAYSAAYDTANTNAVYADAAYAKNASLLESANICRKYLTIGE